MADSYAFRLDRGFSANKMRARVPVKVCPFTGRKSGGMVNSTAYNEWRESAGWQMREQGVVPRLSGPVRLRLTIGTTYRAGTAVKPIPEKFDGDNLVKPIGDLLVTMGVIDDDSWRNAPETATRFSPAVVGVQVEVEPLAYRLIGKGHDVEIKYP